MIRPTPRTAVLLLTLAALAAPGSAAAAPVKHGPVDGRVLALAVTGDTVVLVRKPDRGTARVEVRQPGLPVRVLQDLAGEDTRLATLAVSSEAVAVSWSGAQGYEEDGDRLPPSHAMGGPLSGPLRPLADCAHGFGAPVLAVDGHHIAYTEGSCAGIGRQRYDVAPGALVVADADPAAPVARFPFEGDNLPSGVTLSGGVGALSVLRPTFAFSSHSDLRRFSAEGLESPGTRLADPVALAVGSQSDGTPVLERVETDDDYDSGYDESKGICGSIVGPVPTGATGPTEVKVGGCLAVDPYADDDDVLTPTAVSADRVVARVDELRREDFGSDVSFYRDGTAITRTPLAGGAPEVLSRTDRRDFGPVAADATHAAWTQVRCAGGTEVVSTDVPAGEASSCSAQLKTRRARVTGRKVTLQLRCGAEGCSGQLGDDSRCYGSGRSLGSFAFGPGTHSVRVKLRKETIRSGRLLLATNVRGGRRFDQVVRLRGKGVKPRKAIKRGPRRLIDAL